MKILITGGGGYIGSFMTKRLLDENYQVVVLDNLERGDKNVIDLRSDFLEGSTLDDAFLEEVFRTNQFDAVIHFAGYISMRESMEKPGMYFINNVFSPVKILEKMVKYGVKRFIFSSTAGVYGNPIKVPIAEDHVKIPTNPYGESKKMVEDILVWYERVYKLSFICLRYFNAAGAALDGNAGENHNPETHLIPNAITSALSQKEFLLFGNDYETKDGTCIRDYIHVLDLVEAHVLALKKLEVKEEGNVYNVGTGNGYSNKEIIEMVKKISELDFPIKIGPRRQGDAAILIADASKIKRELEFVPQYSDLETIVRTAWVWHSKQSAKNEK